MKLTALPRARVALTRPLVRAILASPALRAMLARSRAAAGLDPDLAAILRLDDLTHDSEVWRGSPERARRMIAESAAIVEDLPPGVVTADDLSLSGPGGELRAQLYVLPGSPRRLQVSCSSTEAAG